MSLLPLKQQIQEGFYVRNLYELARSCRDLALETDNSTPFFVMEQIFLNVARDWDDRPLQVGDAKVVESTLVEPITSLIRAIELDASDQQIYGLVNDLVLAYLQISDK